jgi:hypothetical protein
MTYLLSFLCGLFTANGIPHFVNGVSGKDFHKPSVGKLARSVPSPLLNVIWGITNFALALLLRSACPGLHVGANLWFGAFALGFIFAAIGLSIYFPGRNKDRSTISIRSDSGAQRPLT